MFVIKHTNTQTQTHTHTHTRSRLRILDTVWILSLSLPLTLLSRTQHPAGKADALFRVYDLGEDMSVTHATESSRVGLAVAVQRAAPHLCPHRLACQTAST